MATSSPASDYAELRVRSLLWRLPLVAVVLIGLIALKYLDGLLGREYANEAQTQAVQTDALLESFLRHRFALIHSERALIATARTQSERRERFSVLATQIMADAPDMFSLYLLDARGVVTQSLRRADEQLPQPQANHFDLPERAEALDRAREEQRPAVTRSISLVGGARGMLVYVPVIRGNQIIGYIGGGLAYQALFNDALASNATPRGRADESGDRSGGWSGFPFPAACPRA